MERAKPWQIVVIAIGFLVLIGMVVYQVKFAGDEVDLADEIALVDVETGDLFIAKTKPRVAMIYPTSSPKTKKASLFPVVKREDGWFVTGNFLGDVNTIYKGKAPAIADSKTGKVNTVAGEPQRYSVGK